MYSKNGCQKFIEKKYIYSGDVSGTGLLITKLLELPKSAFTLKCTFNHYDNTGGQMESNILNQSS